MGPVVVVVVAVLFHPLSDIQNVQSVFSTNSFGATNIEASFVLVAALTSHDSPVMAAAKIALVSEY